MSKLPSAFAKHLNPARSAQPNQAAALKANIAAALRRAKEHIDKGEIREAEQICMAVLTKAPENVDALLLAASLAHGVDDISLEIAFLNKAVTLVPRSVAVHLSIANAYYEVHDHENAIEHFHRAFALKPEMQVELGGLGRAYAAAGKAELALPLFQKLLKLRPDHRNVRIDYANALIGLGRMDEAAALLRENIDRGFKKSMSLKTLADTKKFTGDPVELRTLSAELASPDATDADRMHLHHAMGKILNDVGRYEEAIDHFRQSKQFTGYDFDVSDFRKRADTLIAAFTPSLLKSKAALGDQSEVPVFVVGMPRSGTTLIEQICSSHPDVFGAGELTKMGNVLTTAGYAQAPDGTIAKHPQSLTAPEAKTLADDYLTFLKRQSPTSARIVDKMPHNFQYLGMIALLFPNARIIHCTRDPIDNCLSCFFNTFNEKHGYNTDLNKLGVYYREYDRLMRHWHALLPGRIYEARYETMVANQEEETRRLIEFLGLPWDDACLRFYDNDRTVTTPSRWQVRQPIYASSVRRWEKYGAKIQPLVDALGDLAKV